MAPNFQGGGGVQVPVMLDDAAHARLSGMHAALCAINEEYGIDTTPPDFFLGGSELRVSGDKVLRLTAPRGAALGPGLLGEAAPPARLSSEEKVARYVRGLQAVDAPDFPPANTMFNRMMVAAYKHLSKAEYRRLRALMALHRVGAENR